MGLWGRKKEGEIEKEIEAQGEEREGWGEERGEKKNENWKCESLYISI